MKSQNSIKVDSSSAPTNPWVPYPVKTENPIDMSRNVHGFFTINLFKV
jgi:hypothetical protein